MKKIFVLTGEPSGDKLASEVVSEIIKKKTDLEFLSVGGTNLEKLGIKTIYDQKEITYIAFTDILLNFFKIKRKIKDTVDEVLKFNPDILFSVDSPDFTLRVAKLVKEKNPKIKGVGQPLRIMLTGSKFGPGIYDIILSLGKNEVIKRLGNIG